jgi:hypothetical protein
MATPRRQKLRNRRSDAKTRARYSMAPVVIVNVNLEQPAPKRRRPLRCAAQVAAIVACAIGVLAYFGLGRAPHATLACPPGTMVCILIDGQGSGSPVPRLGGLPSSIPGVVGKGAHQGRVRSESSRH